MTPLRLGPRSTECLGLDIGSAAETLQALSLGSVPSAPASPAPARPRSRSSTRPAVCWLRRRADPRRARPVRHRSGVPGGPAPARDRRGETRLHDAAHATVAVLLPDAPIKSSRWTRPTRSWGHVLSRQVALTSDAWHRLDGDDSDGGDGPLASLPERRSLRSGGWIFGHEPQRAQSEPPQGIGSMREPDAV